MSHQNDVTTFAGFGSWMSTFTPQDQGNPQPRPQKIAHSSTYELEGNSPVSPINNASELPADNFTKKQRQYSDDHVKPSLPAPIRVSKNEKVIKKPTPTFKEVKDPISRIEVDGLLKGKSMIAHEEIINESSYCLLADINAAIERKGYRTPLAYITKSGSVLRVEEDVSVSDSRWPVLVTTGKSCYDPDICLRINMDEPFGVFLSRLQTSVKVGKSKKDEPQLEINGGDLVVKFYRTLRVPEDGRVHNLPAASGVFPLQNIGAYDKKLRASNNGSLIDMAQKGGVFFPMFQREAMYMKFSTAPKSEYVVRAFVGGINVVSGRKWDAARTSSLAARQDYIIAPDQQHLDGIAVADDVVRQFVAMPIGSGYSVEKQLTGREDVGGLQLEITPVTSKLMLFDREGDEITWEHGENSGAITPRIYGLTHGDDIFVNRWGSGKPFLGGKQRMIRKTTLRELVDSDDANLAQRIRARESVRIFAVYKISLTITVHGKMLKHKIKTNEFSPFETLETVAEDTEFRGKYLWDYDFYHDGRLVPEHTTVLEVATLMSSQLIAKPKLGNKRGKSSGFDNHSYFPSSGALRGGRGMTPGMAPTRPSAQPDPDSWAMGLAIGGKIRQEIRKDNDIHRSQRINKGATALVNVQLLNSIAYEALTGMVCPAPPISLENYKKAGIPWFDSYEDNAASTDGAKNFGKVKSVSSIDNSETLHYNTSIAESRNVGCVVCKKNLCDSILRPCSHAFCASCVRSRMTRRGTDKTAELKCWQCDAVVTQILGFSAPMALPGEEAFLPDASTEVVTLSKNIGKFSFELE